MTTATANETKADLLAQAASLGLTVSKRDTKAQLRRQIMDGRKAKPRPEAEPTGPDKPDNNAQQQRAADAACRASLVRLAEMDAEGRSGAASLDLTIMRTLAAELAKGQRSTDETDPKTAAKVVIVALLDSTYVKTLAGADAGLMKQVADELGVIVNGGRGKVTLPEAYYGAGACPVLLAADILRFRPVSESKARGERLARLLDARYNDPALSNR